MNYTQATDEIEQLKIGNIVPDTKKLLQFFCEKMGQILPGKIIYVPKGYENDSIGEVMEKILKEHKVCAGRFTSYAIKKRTGHIFVNGKNISQKEYAALAEKILELGNDLTQTEINFLIALKCFTEKKCDYIILSDGHESYDIDVEIHKRTLQKQIFSTKEYKELEICSASKKDIKNSAVAIYLLNKQGIELKETAVRKALKSEMNSGRFEIVKSKPYFILDGANDGKSTKELMANLQYYFPENPYIFIVGTLQYGYEEVLKECAYMAGHIITVTVPENRNALSTIELAEEFAKLNPNITNASSLEEALEISMILAGKDAVIVAFGTTCILGPLKEIIERK